jgi:thiol:disulfide interchange protein DsbD
MMPSMKRWSFCSIVLLGATAALAFPAAWAQSASAVVTTPQVRAELLVHAPQGVATGQPLALALRIEHAPQWHTYWKNPGDSGLPTTLAFMMPAGFKVGEIAWPTPKRLPIGPLMNFGYEGRLLLQVPVDVPAGFAAESLTVKLHAEWLVCKEVCIPEQGDFALTLPARASSAMHAAEFAAALAAVPRSEPGASASARVDGNALAVQVLGLPAAWQGKTLQFFPEAANVLDNAAPVKGQWKDGAWQASLPLDAQRSASPATLGAVLTTEGVNAGIAVAVEVTTPWPAVAQAPPLPPLTTPATSPSATSTSPSTSSSPPAEGTPGLMLALVLALAGGALLNLMPCVFPVLSLKVMGFAQHAHDRRTLLGGALAYAAGVVLSFVALAALMLALRAGGEQLGWGFQLQSSGFIAALALLFTLIGLNLAGLFEFGSVLPSSWAAARARHPLVDHALTGVLAVAVASPCTAPFMGAALGAALGLPTAQALAIFAALGIGMAAPYVAVSAWPALAARLPRPGAWMAHFKALMAFPMFATVVWLVWVLGQQAGIDAVAALLGLLVAVAFAAWAIGSSSLGPTARRGFGVAALVLLAATLWWALPSLRSQEAAHRNAAAKADEGWLPWSPERVAAALAEGRGVFVDFTAAWCVTCQFNKRTTLAKAEVKSAFADKRVLLLRADWTRRDAAISAELARLARSGVPVYAVYTPGEAQPQLLSEILSVAEVTAALAKLP